MPERETGWRPQVRSMTAAEIVEALEARLELGIERVTTREVLAMVEQQRPDDTQTAD